MTNITTARIPRKEKIIHLRSQIVMSVACYKAASRICLISFLKQSKTIKKELCRMTPQPSPPAPPMPDLEMDAKVGTLAAKGSRMFILELLLL